MLHVQLEDTSMSHVLINLSLPTLCGWCKITSATLPDYMTAFNSYFIAVANYFRKKCPGGF
jgi:hypothetical protein